METEQITPIAEDKKFYSNAVQYWSNIPPTVDGMLGGFGSISQTDIKDSKLLLKQLFASREAPEQEYALDCGAGIGRITKHLLLNFFKKVDLVEQNADFLDQARHYIGPALQTQIGNYFPVGLQCFTPEPKKYDVIWMQWVLGHLTDVDLEDFFKLCIGALKNNGVIVVKENISSSDDIDEDKNDSSVTRPLSLFHTIFARSGLTCYRQVKQRSFPKALYTVYMFILKPKLLVEVTIK